MKTKRFKQILPKTPNCPNQNLQDFQKKQNSQAFQVNPPNGQELPKTHLTAELKSYFLSADICPLLPVRHLCAVA